MPSDADADYEPALDSTTAEETSTESEPVVKRGSPSAVAEAAAKIGEPVADVDGVDLGPRGPRQVSDKTRAMFRDVVAKVQAGEVSVDGDLEPMEHVKPPAAATPAVAVAPVSVTPVDPPPVAAAAVAPTPAPAPAPAPLPPPPPLPPPVDTRAVDAREKQIADREAALEAREKLLPSRVDLIERPGVALAAYLRDVYGASEAELKDVLTDVMTELSETALGVTLPAEVKNGMEARKALRSVKAYKDDLTKQQASLAEQRAAQEKQLVAEREAAELQQRERQAVMKVAELLGDQRAREQFKFLLDPDLVGDAHPANIVIEIVKEQLKQGQKADWQAAARYADDHYKSQAEVQAKKGLRFQSLLAPAAPAPAVAPAKAATSPGGAPGPAPTTPATPAPEWDPSDLPMDRQQRRQASLARLVAAKKAAPQRA